MIDAIVLHGVLGSGCNMHGVLGSGSGAGLDMVLGMGLGTGLGMGLGGLCERLFVEVVQVLQGAVALGNTAVRGSIGL